MFIFILQTTKCSDCQNVKVDPDHHQCTAETQRLTQDKPCLCESVKHPPDGAFKYRTHIFELWRLKSSHGALIFKHH